MNRIWRTLLEVVVILVGCAFMLPWLILSAVEWDWYYNHWLVLLTLLLLL